MIKGALKILIAKYSAPKDSKEPEDIRVQLLKEFMDQPEILAMNNDEEISVSLFTQFYLEKVKQNPKLPLFDQPFFQLALPSPLKINNKIRAAVLFQSFFNHEPNPLKQRATKIVAATVAEIKTPVVADAKSKTSAGPNTKITIIADPTERLVEYVQKYGRFFDANSLAILSATSKKLRAETNKLVHWWPKLSAIYNPLTLAEAVGHHYPFTDIHYQNWQRIFSVFSKDWVEKLTQSWELYCLSGDPAAIAFLIRNNFIDAATKNTIEETPLYITLLSGNVKTAEEILKLPSINLNAVTLDGKNILHAGFISGSLEMATFALSLKSNISVHSTNKRGWNILHFACLSNSIPLIKLALQQQIDPLELAANGINILHIAARNGSPATVIFIRQWLHQNNYALDPRTKDTDKRDAFWQADQRIDPTVKKAIRAALSIPFDKLASMTTEQKDTLSMVSDTKTEAKQENIDWHQRLVALGCNPQLLLMVGLKPSSTVEAKAQPKKDFSLTHYKNLWKVHPRVDERLRFLTKEELLCLSGEPRAVQHLKEEKFDFVQRNFINYVLLSGSLDAIKLVLPNIRRNNYYYRYNDVSKYGFQSGSIEVAKFVINGNLGFNSLPLSLISACRSGSQKTIEFALSLPLSPADEYRWLGPSTIIQIAARHAPPQAIVFLRHWIHQNNYSTPEPTQKDYKDHDAFWYADQRIDGKAAEVKKILAASPIELAALLKAKDSTPSIPPPSKNGPKR